MHQEQDVLKRCVIVWRWGHQESNDKSEGVTSFRELMLRRSYCWIFYAIFPLQFARRLNYQTKYMFSISQILHIIRNTPALLWIMLWGSSLEGLWEKGIKWMQQNNREIMKQYPMESARHLEPRENLFLSKTMTPSIKTKGTQEWLLKLQLWMFKNPDLILKENCMVLMHPDWTTASQIY